MSGGNALLAAAPVLGLGGYALFGPYGFAAGWMIGSWLYNRKQQQDNEIFDPGAQEMPRFNQALRGVTMPVLFGTNRVPAQIVYQGNYTVIRTENQESGGGKGGGSGGGKGAVEQGSVNYEYKWDLIYHLGMVPEGYSLYGGWLGADRLNDSTILSIYSTSPLLSNPVNDAADLTFDDAHFATGNAEEAVWSYMALNGMQGIKWPRTAWVGFDQLYLGNSPRVPQLNFEVGPGGAEFSFESEFYWNKTTAPLGEASYRNKQLWVTGTDGNLYVVDPQQSSVETDTMAFMRGTASNTVIDSITANDIWDDIKADIGAQDGDNDLATAGSGAFQCYGAFTTSGGNSYILFCIENLTGNPSLNVYWALYSFNGTSFVYEGASVQGATTTNTSRFGLLNCKAIGVYGLGTDDDPIMVVGHQTAGGSGQYGTWVAIVTSVNQLKSGLDIVSRGSSNTEMASRAVNMAGGTEDVRNLLECSSYAINQTGSYNTCPWVMPSTVDGLTFTSRLIFWVDAGTVQWHIDNPAAAVNAPACPWLQTYASSYPNGMLVSIPFTVNAGTKRFTTSPDFTDDNEVVNSNLLLTDGITSAVGNMGEDTRPGGSSDSANYVYAYQSASIPFYLDNGGVLVFFARFFTTEEDTTPVGTLHTLRAFVWNALTGTLTQVAGPNNAVPFDPVADGGFGSRYDNKAFGLSVYYRQSDGLLVYATSESGGLGSWTAGGSSHIGEYGSFSLSGGNDVTPPYIIREIMVNSFFGLGIDEAAIDLVSYGEAVAYCQNEEILVSVQYRREQSALQIIEELLSVYGGFLTISGGKIKFGLVRADSSDHTGRVVDNDHLITEQGGQPPVEIVEGAAQDTFNKVRVNYYDRTLDYQQNQIEEQDEVSQDLSGIRMREYPLRFVMSQQTARKMALRTLWTNLYERDTYSFMLGWKDADLEPGDVITLVDSWHNQLQSGKNVRIVDWKEKVPGKFEVTAREELGYATTAISSYSTVSSGQFIDRLTPRPGLEYAAAYELPNEFQISDQGQVYVGWRADAFASGAEIHLSADGTTYALASNVQPYPLAGTILSHLPSNDQFVENAEVLLFPHPNSWSVNSPTYTQTGDIINEAGVGARALGGSLIWIGSEMLAYEGVNLVGLNRYRFDRLYRGWGGTFIHEHNSGDNWHKHGAGIYSQAFTENYIGTTIYIKVRPYNLSGQKYDLSSINAITYTVVGANYLPQVPNALRYVVGSAETGNITKLQHSGPIEIDWRDSARKSGYGFFGYGATGYGDFTADIQSHWWTVNVVGSGNSVVRSLVVTTPHYSYSSGDNASDNGAWRGNVAFTVRHRNAYGVAPRTSVLSMELFL